MGLLSGLLGGLLGGGGGGDGGIGDMIGDIGGDSGGGGFLGKIFGGGEGADIGNIGDVGNSIGGDIPFDIRNQTGFQTGFSGGATPTPSVSTPEIGTQGNVGGAQGNVGAIGQAMQSTPTPEPLQATGADKPLTFAQRGSDTYGVASNPDQVKLGEISSKYETGGRGPGTISGGQGDKGGASYGSYQFASKNGALDKFLTSSGWKDHFGNLKPGTSAFNAKWKEAAKNPDFGRAQHHYIKKQYYEPVRSYADQKGIPNTNAVNQALWSTSVQHGPGGARKLINKSYSQGLGQRGFITNLYNNRGHQFRNSRFYNSSASRRSVRDGVLNRYKNESKDILGLIGN